MTPRPAAVLSALWFALTVAACDSREAIESAQAAESKSREARLDTALADSGGPTRVPIARWVLPTALREVSGLALIGDGRVLAHGDEHGVIWEIDYRRGVLERRFSVGTPAIGADFEGIANANGRLFLLSSNGKLFEFREGKNREHVNYTSRDTHHEKDCEFEGIAFDSTLNALLLACKHVLNKSLSDGVLIFRLPLDSTNAPLPPIAVPLSQAAGNNGWSEIRPSDIAVDPVTGNYVLVAAQQQGLITITPSGEVLRSEPLPRGHSQPEGLAVTRDHILIVSDEAGSRAASITLYRWR